MANDPINWFGNQTFLPQSQQTQMPYGPPQQGYVNAPQQDPNQPPAWFLAFLNQGQQQPQAPSYGPMDAARAFQFMKGGGRRDMSGNLSTGDPELDQQRHDRMWAAKFSSPTERATKESIAFNIPYDQTRTAQEGRMNSLTPQQRINERLGFTADMTPEQKRAILVANTPQRTPKTFIPAPSYDADYAKLRTAIAKNPKTFGFL